MQLSHNAEQITVVAEDDYGNIVKKKIFVAELSKEKGQAKDLKTDDTKKSQQEAKSSIEHKETVQDTKGELVEEVVPRMDVKLSVVVNKNSSDQTEKGKEHERKESETVIESGVTMESKEGGDCDKASGGSIDDVNKYQETNIVKTDDNVEINKSYEHLTTTSNSTKISEKQTLPLGNTTQIETKAADESDELSSHTSSDKANGIHAASEDSKQNSLPNIVAESPDKNHNSELSKTDKQRCNDNDKKTTLDTNSKFEHKGQHVSLETAEDIQGNNSDRASSDTIYGVNKGKGSKNLQAETEYLNAADVHLSSSDITTFRKEEFRPVQSSSSIADNSRLENGIDNTLSENVSEVMLNHVSDVGATEDPQVSEVSETDEDVMKNSAESQDSEDLAEAVQQVHVVEADNKVDNNCRNEQHNMAIQQTVASNEGKKDGNEMVESFHMENGNANL